MLKFKMIKNFTWSRQRLIYVFLLLLLAAILPVIVQKGMASAYHFKSRFYIDHWQKNNPPTQLQYSAALLAADNAYNLDSKNPHYLLTLAKVMEWGVYANFAAANNALFNQLYTNAISQRPTWPNAYSDYAYNLAFIQHDVSQVWPLLDKAVLYGPYTPEVLHQILAIGFAYWPQLTLVQKKNVFETARISAMASWDVRTDLKRLATQYDMTPIVCTYFKFITPEFTPKDKNWVEKELCR
ncbi:hypothetical protein ACFL6Z_10040 [Pseudomonadota bacterium]|uniref:hypothetical protein n=1 Tax=unclassified Shewanella TaxID=196818 RepID=UPI000C83A9D7|nr:MULTISPECIES: hypothetical protein [unclassified Shewanella]MDO6619802.1 hypothetical protein [Shewanella sp. 6_MG-2023]MDO6638961.1 hypothetical protein [Shewanella sp. 5_MG-2023]MDO6676984.1 hypothetical protein [Shewanella sp. 4_MG-2023]MDO6774035.1 hypothetical protein [Shewanella sp. 3_MG-2023]PMG27604.1 hypothetical protein BCU94_04385 [Shewanella sp. 10N.286.52.C2]